MRATLHREPGAKLHEPLKRFYEVFPDEFDFVFFFVESEGLTYGIHVLVNRPAIPGTGIRWSYRDPNVPAEKLRSAIVLRLGNNGPTLHELAHHWAVELPSSMGFMPPHWGYAGVNGQLGGFDPDSLECENPPGAKPPCEPDDDGPTSYVVDSFGLNANGGDSIPYAPLELYLMGLLPPEEVPDVPIFEGIETSLPLQDGRRLFRARGPRIVTIDDIIAVHGLRPLATEEERHFRAAFVLVTSEQPTLDQIRQADNWVAVFACQKPNARLYCFDDATHGLATISVDLPAVP